MVLEMLGHGKNAFFADPGLRGSQWFDDVKKINSFRIGKYEDLKKLVVKRNIQKLYTKKQIYMKLKKKDLILSPSDFGFHNIVKKKQKLYFFDFEYSGVDDPVKLICDYICQPDYKINNPIYFIGKW